MVEKRISKILYMCAGTSFILFIILMIKRVMYSVNLGDEASYVATSYRILRGDLPYAEIWDPQQNVPLLLSPLLFVYEKVVGGWDGVLLFMREMFVVLSCGCVFVQYYLLRKKGRLMAFCMTAPIVFAVPFSIPYISYNTLSLLIFYIGVTLIYSIDSSETEKSVCRKVVLCGILFAFNCFVHPAFVFMAVIYTAVIIYTVAKMYPTLLAKSIRCYVLAGVLGALFILLPIILFIGIEKIVIGIKGMLESPYFVIAESMPSLLVQCKGAFVNFGSVKYLRNGIIVFAFAYSFVSILAYKRREISRYRFIPVIIGFAYLICMLIKVPQYAYRSNCYVFLLGVIIWIWISDRKEQQRIFVQILLPVIVLVLLRTCTTANSDMLYQFFPAVIFMYIVIQEIVRNGCGLERIGVVCVYLIASVALLMSFYQYVYGDGQITTLTARIDSGMFKGIYTSEQRHDELMRLEKDVMENIMQDEKLALVTAFPSVYVTANAEVCSPTVLNPMFTGYGHYEAEPITDYFEVIGDVPDVIAIVLGRSAIPEYDAADPKYELNQYLHENYYLDFESSQEQLYRLILYRRKQNF